jgi:hypothetical protein
MIFGIFYLRNREKMAMIERGMDPRINKEKSISRNYVLTWGLLLIGSGISLFLAYVLDYTVFVAHNDENEAIYFSLIAIFGGAGLFLAYIIEKKDANKDQLKD